MGSFIIPDPMANHKAGLVTEVDPEWEQEVAPYDPTAVAMSKPVIRLFQNMPKKARREARAKDRLRIQALLEAEERNKAAQGGCGPETKKPEMETHWPEACLVWRLATQPRLESLRLERAPMTNIFVSTKVRKTPKKNKLKRYKANLLTRSSVNYVLFFMRKEFLKVQKFP